VVTVGGEAVADVEMAAAVWGQEMVAVLVAAVSAAAAATAAVGEAPSTGRSRVGGRKQTPEPSPGFEQR
jgi:hypothetical protein